MAHAKERPFLATFALPLEHGAASLDAGEYSGLLATQVVVDRQTPMLLSYWKSRADFDRCGAELGVAAGATTRLDAKQLIHYREPARPLWRRVPWYTVIVTTVAIVGCLSALRSEYRNLRTAPQMLPLAKPGEINYLAGDSIDDSLLFLTNPLPVTQRVTIQELELIRSGRVLNTNVIALPSTLPISENTTGSVRLKTATNAADPGKYLIKGLLRIRAGYLGGEIERQFFVPVHAWNPEPVLDEGSLRIRQSNETECQLQGELLLGVPAGEGVVCHITINRHPEISTVYVRFPREKTLVPWSPHTSTKGAETGSASFLLSDVAPMKPQSFFIELESSGPTDWNEVLKHTKVMFSRYRKEG